MRKLQLLLILMMTISPSHAEDGSQQHSPDAARSSQGGSDLLLRNGRFYTAVGGEVIAGSMLVAGGRIAFVGPADEAEALRGSSAEVIELDGRAVTPGLVDAHAHLLGLGRALGEVDLVGTGSYEEVVRRIVEAAHGAPAGEWIMGRGWDQNDWAVKDFPHHDALSVAVPDHPVWMRRIDGHAALLNASAMERLGIEGEIKDPLGGLFLRDEDGIPTGVLIDRAMDAVSSGIPAPTIEQKKRWIQEAAAHCLARGLTTVTDMGIGQTDYEAYAALRAAGELAIRSALFLEDEEALLAEWLSGQPVVDEEARLLVRGVKLYADGALGSRGAALVEAYADDPDNLGLLTSSSEHMAEVCGRALDAGFQVGIHAIGDRGALVSLDAFDVCFQGEPRPEARFRLEHAQVMRLQDIDRLAQLGVIASMQPTHATSDMPWAGDRVGAHRLEGAYAWRRMIDAGAVLALGSDFPVERADPLLGFYAAISRQDLDGEPEGGWRATERLTRQEALKGFTLDAAYSLFLDDEVGTLQPGKRADLVVFDRDPMAVPMREVPSVRVDMTLVDGAVVYSREVSR